MDTKRRLSDNFLENAIIGLTKVPPRATLVWDLRNSFISEFMHRLLTTNFDVVGFTESGFRSSDVSVDTKMQKFHDSFYLCLSVCHSL